MFEVYQYSEAQLVSFGLVLLRMSAFIVAMPVVGGEQVPRTAKILLALILSSIVFSILSSNGSLPLDVGNQLVLVAFKEVIVGVALGFIARIFFFAITIAGEVISISVGLSSEQLLNPALGGRTTALQQFHVFLGTVLFFAVNGHYYLFAGIFESYTAVPISLDALTLLTPKQIGIIGQEVILAGVKMAAPLMVAIFFMNVVMGIMGRAVPQINVLITSLPVNVLVGLLVVLFSVPLMVVFMNGLTELMANRLFEAMKTF